MVSGAMTRGIKRGRIKQTRFDFVTSVIIIVILIMVLLIVAYPLIYVISASISEPIAVHSGKMILWPVDITFEGYQRIFRDNTVLIGFSNSIVYTTVGVVLNIVMTVLGAYPLSRKDLVGRNAFMGIFAFTMFFSGGLIPSYLVVKMLGLNNTMWALVIPPAISVYNMIVMRTYFETSIPSEIYDASTIDGCDDYQYLFRVLLPLSMPIIAVMVLFYGSGHWNMFFDAIIYIRDSARYPLQVILRNILIKNVVPMDMMDEASLRESIRAGEIIKYALILISTVPMMVAYPFIQKYFAKGVLVGSIKG